MLIGNVGNDPEVRYLDSQNSSSNARVARFRLATTERYRDRSNELRENTEWHSITSWRNSAEYVEKFVRKGSMVYVEGKLRTRQWTDQTGATRYTTEIEATNIQLLGKRPEGQQGEQPAAPAASQPVAAPAWQPQPAPVAPAPAPEDDLPF